MEGESGGAVVYGRLDCNGVVVVACTRCPIVCDGEGEGAGLDDGEP